MSSAGRKARREGLVKRRRAQKKADRAYYGQCDDKNPVTTPDGTVVPGCLLDAVTEHVCKTCEALVEAGKPGKGPDGTVYRRKVCEVHRGAGLEDVKKHALAAHPLNIVRMAAAIIKGDA